MDAFPHDTMHGLNLMLRNQRQNSFSSDSGSSSDSAHSRRASVMVFGEGFSSLRRSMSPRKLRQRLTASFSAPPSGSVDVGKMYITMGWEKARARRGPSVPAATQTVQPMAVPSEAPHEEEVETPTSPTSPLEIRLDDEVVHEAAAEEDEATEEAQRLVSRLSMTSVMMAQVEASETWSPLD